MSTSGRSATNRELPDELKVDVPSASKKCFCHPLNLRPTRICGARRSVRRGVVVGGEKRALSPTQVISDVMQPTVIARKDRRSEPQCHLTGWALV